MKTLTIVERDCYGIRHGWILPERASCWNFEGFLLLHIASLGLIAKRLLYADGSCPMWTMWSETLYLGRNFYLVNWFMYILVAVRSLYHLIFRLFHPVPTAIAIVFNDYCEIITMARRHLQQRVLSLWRNLRHTLLVQESRRSSAFWVCLFSSYPLIRSQANMHAKTYRKVL